MKIRIAICGKNKESAISKIEEKLQVSAKIPWETENKPSIIDYAAETYKYFNEDVVVFSGSAFDFLLKSEGEGYDDVNEQIAISSLMNLNYIIVFTEGMDEKEIKAYKEFESMFPDKFFLYNTESDFTIA